MPEVQADDVNPTSKLLKTLPGWLKSGKARNSSQLIIEMPTHVASSKRSARATFPPNSETTALVSSR